MCTPPALAAPIAAFAPTLTACGAANTTYPAGGASPSDRNETEIQFATHMVQHHAQALSLVDLAVGRDLDPKVAALAEDIRSAHAPELDTMVDRFGEWDVDTPEPIRDYFNSGQARDGMGGLMEGVDTDMPGGQTNDESAALANADDAEFQKLWLLMIFENQEGAVEMAEDQEADGKYPARGGTGRSSSGSAGS